MIEQNSPKLVKRLDLIKTICTGKDVLNLGCADATRVDYAIQHGEHLHYEVSKVAKTIVGIDLNQDALRTLRNYGINSELICHDVESLSDLSIGLFDVVVAGELIEHLSNPGKMLNGARALLKRDGIVVITTPNALSLKLFLHNLMRGHDASSDYHTLIFSPKTLRQILVRHGFYKVHLFYSVWTLPSMRSRMFQLIAYPLLRIRPQLADTIIAVAAKQNE